MSNYTTLIEASELATLLELDPASSADAPAKAVVLDCRATLGDPRAGPTAWAKGHIPGAVHADLETQLAAPAHSGPANTGGRHPLPDRGQLADQCSDWGIDRQTQVVAYDDAGGAYAARAWWLLRWLGHAKVAVLNGGLSAWCESSDRTLVASDTRKPASAEASFTTGAPLTRVATLADMIEQVSGTTAAASACLLDARAQERFDGKVEPIDPVAGHIPGALCMPLAGNLDSTGRFLPPEQLARRFEASGNPDDLICYCGSGVTAAHNILAICHAGLPEPRLYVGSWSEWSADPKRPVA